MLLIFCIGSSSELTAQIQVATTGTTPLKIAEICKMVELKNEQKTLLNQLYDAYMQGMDSAIYVIEDKIIASKLIYKTKERFDANFYGMLSNKQKIEYIRNYSVPEIAHKTEAKIKTLQDSGNYTEVELSNFYSEIFEYFMLEKIAYVTDKYNITRQKENIAQLKKLEPKSLKTANSLQKAKVEGKTYQKGYQW